MRVKHLSSQAYRVMPWKNGKGSTTELCIGPPSGSVQIGFDWRISLAQVPESGPFSPFPQHERVIMLIEGDPMHLVHEGHGEHILQSFQPYAFHGAWNTTGILTGKPVEDFNVMVREGWGRARVRVLLGTENTALNHPRADLQFVWAFRGSSQIDLHSHTNQLLENESFLIENGPDLLIRLNSPACALIIVSIEILSK